MNERLRTLLLVSAAAGGGYAVSEVTDADAALADDDRAFVFVGSTAAVHALDLRKPRHGDGGGGTAITVTAYGKVQDRDGGVHDLGGAIGAVADGGELRVLLTLMNSAPVRTCARGDSTVALSRIDVHALDLRRSVARLEDGGTNVASSMTAYGNYPISDGGIAYLHGHQCAFAVPDAGVRAFDTIGLGVFKRVHGLGR